MYLADTNIRLEWLLDQKRAGEVAAFLASVESKKLARIFHKIFCIIIGDLFLSGNCKLVTLSPVNFKLIVDSIDKFKLDFDDSCQYVSAKIHKYQDYL